MKTELLDASMAARAAEILASGGLVAIPTETVYGLGANALDEEAVKRIFEVKGRPQDNPLILHVASAAELDKWCRDVPPEARLLTDRFWPGPLTLVLERQPVVPLRVTAGLETVAMRCPDHPLTGEVLRLAGVPVAAPSANLSGKDLNATEWLEDYLLRFRGTVLTISHDRYFLDRAVQRIVELTDGKAELYAGNYSFFTVEKQRRYEEAKKLWEKNQKQIAQLQRAADDLHLWAFMGADKLHKRAFSMEKRIERLKQAEKPKEERRGGRPGGLQLRPRRSPRQAHPRDRQVGVISSLFA